MMMQRRVKYLVAVVLAALLARPVAAQSIDLETFAGNAKRLLGTCDYQAYLTQAKSLSDGLGLIKSLDLATVKGWIAAPTMDVLSTLATAGTKRALDKQNQYEKEGLIFQMEQACQAWQMTQHVKRQMEFARAANWGIERSLASAMNLLGVSVPAKRTAADPIIVVQASMDRFSHHAETDQALMAGVDSTVLSAMRGASILAQQTDSMRRYLDDLQLDLNAYGEDSSGVVLCPPGYPAIRTETATLVPAHGYICGPVAPARAQQVTAAMEATRLQLDAARNLARAHQVEVDAARLMVMSVENRRKRESMATAFRYLP